MESGIMSISVQHETQCAFEKSICSFVVDTDQTMKWILQQANKIGPPFPTYDHQNASGNTILLIIKIILI